MITYKALDDNLPFYKIDEERTKEDWMAKLHLNEEQFKELTGCGGDLMECDTQLQIESVVRPHGTEIFFFRKGIRLSKEDAEKIIENIKKAFPDLSDLLK